MAIYYPPVFINRYLQEKLAANGFGAIPMYPSVPNDPDIAFGFTLDQLTGDDPTIRFPFGGSMAIYDRMFRMRRKPFPHIKSEQLLYYFYAIEEDAVSNLIESVQTIQDLLDDEDESAININSWIAQFRSQNPGDDVLQIDSYNSNGEPIYKVLKTARVAGKDFLLPFFHKIKVYQLEETRDIIDFGTARTYAGNKIFIDYDWHKS